MNSPEDYERLQSAAASDWAMVERVRARNADNADKTEDEVLADVTAEVEAVRQEMYDERRGASTDHHRQDSLLRRPSDEQAC